MPDSEAECINVFSDLGINTINLFTGQAFWETDSPKIGKDITEGQAWDMVLSAYDEILLLAEEKQRKVAESLRLAKKAGENGLTNQVLYDIKTIG